MIFCYSLYMPSAKALLSMHICLSVFCVSSWQCHGMVCVWSMIVALLGHTHLFFTACTSRDNLKGNNSNKKLQKITGNNPGFLSIPMHTQNLVKFYQLVLKTLSGKEIQNKNLTSVYYKCVKIMCYNLDIVNINAYTKVKILSMCSQDIEQQPNYDGMMDGRNDRLPKSSIAPLFKSGAMKMKDQAKIKASSPVTYR